MTTQRVFISSWLILGIVLVGLLSWASLFGISAQAKVAPATPTPTPLADDEKDDGPIGAHIELHATGGAWGVVQWQDSAGNWHDVEGWRGALSAEGKQNWWVDQKDFGTGPFHWVVSQSAAGSAVGVSPPFYLPTEANQVMVITVP